MPTLLAIFLALCGQTPAAPDPPDAPRDGIRLVPDLPWTRGDESPLRLNPHHPDSLAPIPLGFASLEPFPLSTPSEFTPFGPDPFAPTTDRWDGNLPGGALPKPRLGDAHLPALANAALGAAFVYSILQAAPPAKAKPNKLW